MFEFFGQLDQNRVMDSSKKLQVATWSLFASLGLALAKFAAAWHSGSLGVMSEALHSSFDFLATGLTLFAVRYADRPADDDHHFGHGKMESVAALCEAALLFGVTGWIVYEALRRLMQGERIVELSPWIFAVVVASIIIDWNRSRALSRTAEATSSEALAADALHFRADMWSSCAVLIGLGLSYTGFPQADPIAALVVGVFVARAAWQLGKRTLDTLLDAAPHGVTERVSEIAQAMAGVIKVSRIKARPAGPSLFIDLTVDVPRTMAVGRMVDVQNELSSAVLANYPSADVTVLTNPVALDDEGIFDKVMLIAATEGADIHHVTVQDLDGKIAVSFDIEVDGVLALHDAHGAATRLEAAIRAGLGGQAEVESHIEPLPLRLLRGSTVDEKLRAKINSVLAKLAKAEPLMSDLHNLRIRQNEAGLFVHYHCRFAPHTPVRVVHDVVDRIELALMKSMPAINRVVAHAEPVGAEPHDL